jgi:hypothetical protein
MAILFPVLHQGLGYAFCLTDFRFILSQSGRACKDDMAADCTYEHFALRVLMDRIRHGVVRDRQVWSGGQFSGRTFNADHATALGRKA